MRKTSKFGKSRLSTQLDLFASPPTPLDPPSDGIGKGIETVQMLVSRLEKQRADTCTVLEVIADYQNLLTASKHVMKKDGSAGVDGMKAKELEQWIAGNGIMEMQTALLTETYKVQPVKKVEIPKTDGGVRTLGIPTVFDRVVQQAIQQILTQHYDPHFSPYSYGFRPKRSAHDAVRYGSELVKQGKEWVVDIDLEKFFDTICHDRLMTRLTQGIGDKRLLRLINSFLKAGLMIDGLESQREKGTPQGGPLSPLLSNIVLDELDRELEKRGLTFSRYADDCNIFVKTERAGLRVMTSLTTFLESKMKLKVNRAKSAVRHCSQGKFLGFTIMTDGKIRTSDKSIRRFKERIRELTKRNRGYSFESVIIELNEYVRGWGNYYSLSNTWLTRFRELDSWIKRRLRSYKLKLCNRKYAIASLLWSMGIERQKGWNVACYHGSWWTMSKSQTVSKALGNKWFDETVGLLSIERIIKGKHVN